MVRQEEER
jgi:hypothetical protein